MILEISPAHPTFFWAVGFVSRVPPRQPEAQILIQPAKGSLVAGGSLVAWLLQEATILYILIFDQIFRSILHRFARLQSTQAQLLPTFLPLWRCPGLWEGLRWSQGLELVGRWWQDLQLMER